MATPACGDILARTARGFLRHETHDLHLRAEATLQLDWLDRRESYVRLLQAFGRAHEGAHAAIAVRLETGWLAGLDADLDRLRRDLDHLGAGFAAPQPLRVHNRHEGLGVLYVLEGSRLGGRVLARRATAALGVSVAAGAGFLAGDPLESGTRWRDFQARLQRELQTVAALTAARRGARRAFRAYIEALETAGKP